MKEVPMRKIVFGLIAMLMLVSIALPATAQAKSL